MFKAVGEKIDLAEMFTKMLENSDSDSEWKAPENAGRHNPNAAPEGDTGNVWAAPENASGTDKEWSAPDKATGTNKEWSAPDKATGTNKEWSAPDKATGTNKEWSAPDKAVGNDGAHRPEGNNATGGATETSESSANGGAEKAGEGEKKNEFGAAPVNSRTASADDLANADGERLLEMFRNGDPALLEALKGKDASTFLMRIQDALNIENRMFSLMSNVQATEHDTKKAIINNLRA